VHDAQIRTGATPASHRSPAAGGIPLRSGLVLLVLAALVPVLAFAGWLVARMADTQGAAIEERGRHLAQTLVVAVDRELTAMSSALQVLTTSHHLEVGDFAAFHRQATEVLRHKDIRRDGIHIVLTDTAGQQIVSTRRPYGEPLPTAASAAQVVRVAETGQARISDLFSGAVARAPLVSVSVPVWRDGRVANVLSMSIPVEVLSGLLLRQGLPDDWTAAVLDRKGVFITRTLAHERFVGTPAAPDAWALAGGRDSGSYRHTSRDGVPTFYAFARSAVSGWTVSVGVPLATIEAPMRQSMQVALVGGALLLLLSVVMTLAVGRRLSGPVAQLAAAAEALGRGETPGGTRTLVREVNAVGAAMRDAALRLDDGATQQRMAMQAGGIGIWRLDGRTGELRCWGRSAAILGLGAGIVEAPVAHWIRNVPAGHRDRLLATLHPAGASAGAFARGDFDLEFPVEHPDGETRWAALRGAVLGDGGPESRRAVGILEDITERKRALEMQLVEAEERHAADRRLFAAIIESSTDLVAALDLDLRFILFNSAYQTEFEAIFGRRPQIGERLADALSHLPDERGPALAIWSRAVDGERFTVVHDFGDVRHARRTYEIAYDTIVDGAGKRIGAFHLARDVTERERARAALTQAEDTLRQAQKMEAIGHLTGGIAHDFNNLLQAIGASLYLIEHRVTAPEVLEPLRMAVKAVDRGATLTQHLLAFSRRQRLEPRPVDVGALVRNMGGLLERTLGGTIHIAAEADAEPWPALVDPNQLEMAILNLAINARDAMPSGGTLTIRSANAPLGDDDDRPNTLPPGDYVAISVRDTGTGMNDEVAARAFEPFFTTKGVGHGTGLGLSMVHGLAAQSGGAVRLDTRLGEGTMVTLYLPRADGPEEAEAGRDPVPTAAEPARPACVLLVEDEGLVRMATATFLDQSGFRVVEAASGAEALAIVRGGEPVDLVLTDYAMPGMTGLELVRALRAERPDLPALMVTGYTEVPQATLAVEGLTIIQKPYRPDDLVARLHAALAAPLAEAGV